MQFSSVKSLAFIIVSLPFYLHSEITGDLRVCALMVEFKEDNKQSTTGNGKFLNTIEGIDCESYHIDPPPHDSEYFYLGQFFIKVIDLEKLNCLKDKKVWTVCGRNLSDF